MKYTGTGQVNFATKRMKALMRYARTALLKGPSGMEKYTGQKEELLRIRVYHILNLLSSPLKDSSGKIIAGIKIVRDITTLKRVENELREGERFLESIFSSIQDGIGVIDTKMNIIRVNKTAQGWYPHAVPFVGKKCYEAYHNRKEPCEQCPARETLRTGKSSHEIVPKHDKSGKVIGWLEIYSYPLNDMVTGTMNGVIEYVRDITERRHIEEELKQSEEKYRLLIENINEGVFVIQDAKMVFVNQMFAHITGYGIEEIIGMDFRRFVAPGDLEMVQDRYYRRQKGEDVPREYEFHVLRKDGEKPIVNMTVGIVNYCGRVASMGILRDITAKKRSEEALALSNLVVENSQTVLFRWRALEGWPAEFVSNNVVQFGYNAEDFLSGALLYASIIHPEDLERVSKEVDDHSGSGEDRFQQEYRIIAKNGAIHWIDDRTAIERDSSGNITHFQGIIIDITERKHAEEAISKYNKELEESNRMKELFTDIMHHDLLNPLNVAHGYVELFLEDEKNPRKKSYLDTIKRNLVKGMELIDNATKLSKLKSLKSIGFEDLDLRIVVTDVIENLRPLALNAGMSIENNLVTGLPVRANRIIEDIFTNIIINAIKYAPQGKKIVVKGKEEANSCLVKIIDFVGGIKDPDKKLIFERFTRNEKKGVKGSGLGLAIAGRIIELHNGRIWVEDNPDAGAVFVVEIPKS